MITGVRCTSVGPWHAPSRSTRRSARGLHAASARARDRARRDTIRARQPAARTEATAARHGRQSRGKKEEEIMSCPHCV